MKFLALLLLSSIAQAEVIDIKSTEQFNCFIDSDQSILIEFYHKDCGWCKKQKNVLANFETKYEEDITVIKVDVTKFPKLTKKYIGNSGYPTFIYINEDYTVKEVGYHTTNQLESFVFV